jgi:two-component system OmpR family sensor kinase
LGGSPRRPAARKRPARRADAAAAAQPELLALVSHELGNPLASIKGYAQRMRRRGAYDERALEAILAQAARLERLIADLVDAAQAESGQLALRASPTDLSALVGAAAIEAQMLTARHTVRADLPDGPVEGCWDAERLGQVLQNLFGNAVKYAPDGTAIVARLEAVDGVALVSVVDEGPGVPPAALPRLFERFFRAPAADVGEVHGLGLGLYVSRMLVEAHGGRIWAEPSGGGTAFRFVLPRTAGRDARS